MKAQNGKHDRNIVNIMQIVITPPCNFYSCVQLNYKFCKKYQRLLMRKVIIIVIVNKFKIISSMFLDIVTEACYQLRNFDEKKMYGN